MLPPQVKPGGLGARAKSTSCFPISGARASQGTKLSGGEQQMLAIARILRTGAKLLLLDEPTEGLAPVIVQQIGDTIRMLKQQGFTILLVEQNFRFAATVADRHYVVEHGQVIDMIPNAGSRRNRDKLQELSRVCNVKKGATRGDDDANAACRTAARPLGIGAGGGAAPSAATARSRSAF